MRDDLPTAAYERGMNHNYMVLGKCDFFGSAKESSRNYRVRMLLENSIPGLLPITQRQANGETKYYYEINSLQPLARLMEKSALKYGELKALFLGCINIFDRIEEYLLDGGQIIIKPEFIYVNIENMEPYFVCYPDYESDARLSFVEFVDEILTHLDHTDEQAVMLGYQVYRYTRNPNYVISEIKKFMECRAAEIVKTEEVKAETVKPKAVKTEIVKTEAVKSKMLLVENVKGASYNNDEEKEFCLALENEDFAADEDAVPNKSSSIKYLIGGSLGLFTTVCAGGVIICARFLKAFKFSANIELYICGAAVSAFAVAALCLACYIKEVKQKKEIEALNSDAYGLELEDEKIYKEQIERDVVKKNENVYIPSSSDTICLSSDNPQERILKGRVGGKEVNIPLARLPLTVGKLAGMSDFVINDASVSKMHARFDERGGKVCVCDLNSTNGTVVNGETIKINMPIPLEPGDTLRFGRSSFTYL